LGTSSKLDTGGYPKVIAVVFESDLFVVGTSTGYLSVYKIYTWEKIFSLKVHNGPVQCLVYLNDGRTVVSGGSDGNLIKFDVLSHKLAEFKDSPGSKINSIISTLDGDSVHVASDNKVYIYSFNTLTLLDTYSPVNNDETINRLSYLKDEKLVCVGTYNGRVVLYNHTSKSVAANHQEHGNSKITALTHCKIKGNSFVASTAADKTIKVFSLNEKKVVKSLNIPNKTAHHARSIAYCHDEKTLITGHNDGKLFLHNIETATEGSDHVSKVLFSKEEKVTCIAYVGDGNFIISGLKNGDLGVYAIKWEFWF